MSYEEAKQIISGTIPPWQKLLSSVQQMGAMQAMPKTMEEVQDIPRVAGNVAVDATTIPFTDIGSRHFFKPEEPKTDYGQSVRTGLGIAEILLGGKGAANLIDKGIRRKEIGKVMQIQEKFGPWVKGYTKQYGKSLRKGIKDVLNINKHTEGGTIKEVKRIFNPLRRSDSFKDLPAKTQQAISKVSESKNPTPREILNAANRLRKSPQAKKFDETGSIVRETSQKLKRVVKSKSSEFAKVDNEYGEFVGTKKVIEKGFKPELKGQGQFGTAKGTKTLRNIKQAQPGEVEAMERFGKETRLNIVGPAKTASNIRGIGNIIKKSLPWGIGVGGPLFAIKKLTNNKSDYIE